MTNQSIVSQLLATKVPNMLFHYTTSTGLMGILESGKIWTTKIQYMNDKSELQLALEYIHDEIDAQRKGVGITRTEEHLDNMCSTLNVIERGNVSVASFTEIGDQLSQWRGYCEIGNAYSLGFDGPKLKRLVYEKEGYNLLPCIYEENEHRLLVKELINNYPTEEMLLSIVNKFNLLEKDGKTVFMLGFLESLLLLAPLIKARGFKEEKEWRLITPILNVNNAKFRKGNFSLIPYWEFDVNLMDTLKTIIIGPTPEPELSSEAVQDLFLREHSAIYPIAINIYSSEIPFRRI